MTERNKAETPTPGWFSYKQASAYAGGLGRTTLTALVTSGAIPAAKVRKRVLISRAGLDEYLARHSYVGDPVQEAPGEAQEADEAAEK